MRLNGESVPDEVLSVTALLVKYDIRQEGIAVAIDGEIVPRSQWNVTDSSFGCSIEIVTAAAGG